MICCVQISTSPTTWSSPWLVLIVLLVGFLVWSHHRLPSSGYTTTARLKPLQTHSQLAQLKRRYDLIPNLVETVKGYMSHERETRGSHSSQEPGDVGTAERGGRPRNAAAIQALERAEQGLTGALGRLFALSAYPDLKANQNMAQLTEEITNNRK